MQLFVHTSYSFYESNLSIEKYIDEISEINQKYAAITDKNNIYGMWEFINLAKQKSIFPIVGVHIAPKLKNQIYSNGGFLLFLKSAEGFHSFNSIISSSTNKKSFTEIYDTISRLSIRNELEDIIFISLTTGVYNILKQLSIPEKSLYFGLIEDIFSNKPFLVPSLIRFFENFDFPNPIFLSKIFYSKPLDNEFIDILFTCRFNELIKRKSSKNDNIYKKRKPLTEKFTSICKYYNLTEDSKFIKETMNPYHILPESIRLKIFQSIENLKKFPSMFNEIKEKKSIFPMFYDNADILLRNICFSKLKKKKLDNNPSYISRLEYELNIISKKDFSQYFLFVYEIICYAKKNGIIYIGRGSAASSLVSYLLDITEVDPINLNLYFERFLNPQRQSFPDIDIDFSWKERDNIILYVLNKYPLNCCMVSTTLKMNLKGAFRNSAKFYGMDSKAITKYSKLIPSLFYTKDKNKILSILSELGLPENIISMTIKLLNLPFAKGVHPGGIVLSTPDIFSSTPYLFATKGVPISHFDLNYIEKSGLIKIDILSQRALQVLQDSIENINKILNINLKIDFETANNDKKTWEKIRNGDCRGCFYIESAAMVNLLKDLHVSNFLELVAASSVIRPGVSDSGMKDEYILRKTGSKKASYEIPLLKEVLKETFGIMIYQEDVLKVASAVGKLSLSEADLLRKAMSGKSRSKSEIIKLKEKFINGGISQKFSAQSLEKIWSQIESFAGYAFCKAHSASYAVLSVKLAYIRTHFTPYFYAALLNNFGGYYPSLAYNILAIQEGITLDICDLLNPQKQTTFNGSKIIIGLVNFFFLSENEKDLLISISHSFNSEKEYIMAKFIAFSNLDKNKIIKLIEVGYFLKFYKSIFFAKILCETLFLEKNRTLNNLILKEKEFTKLKIYFTENIFNLYYYRYKYFGLFVTTHPFEILQQMLESGYLNDSEINIIENYRTQKIYDNNKIKKLGWLIIYRSTATKNGKLMGFATFFDGNSFIETTLFPDVYSNYYNLLKYYNFFEISLEIQQNTLNSFLLTELNLFLPDFFERLKRGNFGTNN